MKNKEKISLSSTEAGKRTCKIVLNIINKAKVNKDQAAQLFDNFDEDTLSRIIEKYIYENIGIEDSCPNVVNLVEKDLPIFKPSNIEEQIKSLANILNLDGTKALENLDKLPLTKNHIPVSSYRMKGNIYRNLKDDVIRFAIPSPEGIEKMFPNIEDRYYSMLKLITEKFGEKFEQNYHFVSEILNSKKIDTTKRTSRMIERISEQQKGDILIIDCQIGIQYFGFSPKDVLQRLKYNEFGIDIVSWASIILANKNFLTNKSMNIACLGNRSFRDSEGDMRTVCLNHEGDPEKYSVACIRESSQNEYCIHTFYPTIYIP